MRPSIQPPHRQEYHHRGGIRTGTALPPPIVVSVLLAILGLNVDTDQAVLIAATMTTTTAVMILRMSSYTSGLIQSIGIANGGRLT
jgi:hypothetical protein